MTSKLDRVYFDAANAGTGSFVYDQTVAGYRAPVAAGAVDASTYYYIAEVLTGGIPTQWELGVGTWNTDTLTRTPSASSNGGLAVDFTDPPQVRMGTILAADFAGGGGGVTNPMTADLDVGGFAIKGSDGGGSVTVLGGEGESGGSILAAAGDGTVNNGGGFELFGGTGEVDGGGLILSGGGGNTGNGGKASIRGGEGGVNGGGAEIIGGEGFGGTGGSVLLAPSDGDTDGGDFVVDLPSAGSGRQGLVIVTSMPTADPSVSNAWWLDGGVVKASGTPAGFTGTFQTGDALTATVTNGIITDIS